MIDSHVHLVTSEMVGDITGRFEKEYPGFSSTIMENASHLFNRKFTDYISNSTIDDFSKRWLSEMDENGIEKAVFFPISERPEIIRDFVKTAPDRFIGYCFINDPREKGAPEKLRRYVLEYGFKGLKLYPCLHLFHAYDEAMFPLYEEAQSLGIPITFHMGITHAPASDYRFTNPMDLQLPLKLFPKLNIIVAHFGAGFFREVCLLAYHSPNFFVDTSGTNNWRDFTPERMELKDIFKRAIEIMGPANILFGTDTVMKPNEGYRAAIMREQREIVESICNSRSEAELILGGNAERLFC